MVDARRPCPDAALLAAFLDGTLAEYERTAVVTHLAECAQCRSVALAVIEFREAETLDELWTAESALPPEEERAVTRVSRWSHEKTRAPAWWAATSSTYTRTPSITQGADIQDSASVHSARCDRGLR